MTSDKLTPDCQHNIVCSVVEPTILDATVVRTTMRRSLHYFTDVTRILGFLSGLNLEAPIVS